MPPLRGHQHNRSPATTEASSEFAFGQGKRSASGPYWFAGKLPKQRRHCIHAKLRGVERSRRQVAEGTRNEFRRDLTDLRSRFSREQVRQNRTGRDRHHATLGLESDFSEAVPFDASRQPQNITAYRVGHFNDRVGVRKFPGVVRVSEVFERNFVEHQRVFLKLGLREQSPSNRVKAVLTVRPSLCTLVDAKMVKEFPKSFAVRFSK